MIKLINTETYGWEAAIRGMRNPLNSWNKSDSHWDGFGDADGFSVGANDLGLMKRLIKGGTEHRKFLRMINVTVDINAPLYWWKEFDTYKIGTVGNSCSTMHTIHRRDLTLEDFSVEHLNEINLNIMKMVIRNINAYREELNNSSDKEHWWQMIQLLPTSYNQKRTIQLNYEVLLAQYRQRPPVRSSRGRADRLYRYARRRGNPDGAGRSKPHPARGRQAVSRHRSAEGGAGRRPCRRCAGGYGGITE